MGDEFDFSNWGLEGDGDFGGEDAPLDIGIGDYDYENYYPDYTGMTDEELLQFLGDWGEGTGPMNGYDDQGNFVGFDPGTFTPSDTSGGYIGGGGTGGSTGGTGLSGLLSSLGLGNLSPAQLAALGLSIPALGSIFGDEGDPGSTTVTQELPPWYTDAAKGAIGDALYLPDYESFMQVPGALLSEADLAPYMNNYIDATLNPQLVRMGEDFAREGNQLDASAVKTGAFGGSRNVLEHSLAQERQNKRVDEATNSAYSNAFNTAMGLAGQDRGVIYQDFMNQFGNPYMQQDALNKTLGAVRPGTSQTTTGTAAEGNPWDKILGIGSTLWGTMFPQGMNTPQNPPATGGT